MKKTPTTANEPDPQRRLALQSAAAALLGSLSAGLAGCGGGGGTTADAAVAAEAANGRQRPLGGVGGGGTGARLRTFISAVVDSTSPITIGGVRLDTYGSRIADADGNVLDATDILPGMTGQIEAETIRDPGVAPLVRALDIVVAEQLLGPVDQVNPLDGSFTALGQTVFVTGRTVLDGALSGGFAGIQPGVVVTVWGQLDPAEGRIVATRVALGVDASHFVVRGVLTALERATGHVAIGALQALFAADDASVVAPDVVVGEVVRARLAAPLVGAVPGLLALRGDSLRLPDSAAVEIEGRVTRIESIRRFDVDGVEVDATSAASMEGLASLALGALASVRGRASNGVLLAHAVTVEPDEPVELEGAIASPDATQRTFVLRSRTVAWSDRTIFEGGTSNMLTSRRRVSVVGRWNADRTQIEATRIHVEG